MSCGGDGLGFAQLDRWNQEARRAMNPDAIDRVVRKFVAKIGLDRGYSAHSVRATFITTVLENGPQLENVQKVSRTFATPSTTKLYAPARL